MRTTQPVKVKEVKKVNTLSGKKEVEEAIKQIEEGNFIHAYYTRTRVAARGNFGDRNPYDEGGIEIEVYKKGKREGLKTDWEFAKEGVFLLAKQISDTYKLPLVLETFVHLERVEEEARSSTTKHEFFLFHKGKMYDLKGAGVSTYEEGDKKARVEEGMEEEIFQRIEKAIKKWR